MQRKHRLVFQDNVKYINNNISKPFRVGILQYDNHIHQVHDLDKLLPTNLKKEGMMDQEYWSVRDEELT